MNDLIRPFDLFDDFYRPFGGFFGNPPAGGAPAESWLPSVDVRQTEAAFLIEMDVPGFDPEQIEVEAHDGILTVKGTRDEETSETSGTVLRRERRSGTFVRRFSLPAGAAGGDVQARMEKGVLQLTVPRQGTSSPTRIAVS